MNIFALDYNPQLAAQYHHDKHVVKMVLETAQLLSTAWQELHPDRIRKVGSVVSLEGQRIYKSTHKNHPCALWVRKNWVTYRWACEFGLALCKEYTHRYHKTHATEQLYSVLVLNPFELDLGNGMPEFAKVMPEEFITNNPATYDYREYYKAKKVNPDSRWTNREKPSWI